LTFIPWLQWIPDVAVLTDSLCHPLSIIAGIQCFKLAGVRLRQENPNDLTLFTVLPLPVFPTTITLAVLLPIVHL